MRPRRLPPSASSLPSASPPFALARAVGAAGAVERVELGHVLVGEPEVEDLRVLGDALAVRRLRNDRNAPFDAPAQQYLGRSAPMASCDLRDDVAGEVAARSQRAVRLQRDPVPTAFVEESNAELVRAELHLIHDRRHRCGSEHLPQLVDTEVRDPDRPRVSRLSRPFHPGPRPGRATLRPVDDVEVDVVDTEPLQAPLDLREGVLPRGEELRRDEDLLARNAAIAQPSTDALLVAVRLCRIDVPVPELERPANGGNALRPVRHLPDTETEQRHLVAVREHARSSIFRQRIGRHRIKVRNAAAPDAFTRPTPVALYFGVVLATGTSDSTISCHHPRRVQVIERERVQRGWPWSAGEVAEAARIAYDHDWSSAEIVTFIDALRRSSGIAFTPSDAIKRVLAVSTLRYG